MQINSKSSFSNKSREYKPKGKTSPRRKARDISSQFIDFDEQVELQNKDVYEQHAMTETEKRKLNMFYCMRSRENPQPHLQVRRIAFVRRVVNHRQRSEGSRSSAASGDGNSDSDDADPEPERNPQHPLYLFDQQSLADLLCISKKTLQNTYSNTPHDLPVAIQIPHARGPRWTIEAVQDWLANRPKHTQKIAPIPQKRKAGRPRITATIAAVKGGA
ncbi:hypothetical protein A6M27_07655 [Acidithiobacillus thiooxidans]|uniref:Uncharacterized protein n=1 Tax=Acidithiobacillus thiooxidans TaxID=930 RepID=A0A1C2JJR8_ACITH|nr:hypothetical protein [Acidithiobacillus thiooxidans]OCX69562.1 hypothetical protein A6O24_18255 [Acidithiobacillus thiooxidans]OCX70379.1 hypothetical protein A6P07_14565 [Acidithiobacillus thiooxidans]OCX81465.1 hypothetical protein A6O26_13190 [Acidithiobacillus thiooxidans]OCX88436.1 hypothetical protein A6M27_07655 [Acidithiobacillus thiooxidans]OFC40831.1 hypothetical protein BAE47_19295 [Acidithiobacillus thiooxidans]